VVELVKGIEQALPLPQRWALAIKYNLKAHTSQVVLRLLLPVGSFVEGRSSVSQWQAAGRAAALAAQCLRVVQLQMTDS
jgi:hypothetical protein